MLLARFVETQRHFVTIFAEFKISSQAFWCDVLCDNFLQSSGSTFVIFIPVYLFYRHLPKNLENISIFFVQLVVHWHQFFSILGKWKMRYHHSCFVPIILVRFWCTIAVWGGSPSWSDTSVQAVYRFVRHSASCICHPNYLNMMLLYHLRLQ